MDIKDIALMIKKMENELIQIRRDFHLYPEKGYEEFRTSGKIINFLQQYNIPVQSGLVGTGVIARIEGVKEKPVIGIRVDIDALQIEDQTTNGYTSLVNGLAHACGHDIHTTIGLGLCKLFSQIKDRLPGELRVIFQPGEETPKKTNQNYDPFQEEPTAPGGAALMIKEGILKSNKIDVMIGIHCWPSLRVGKIGYQYGAAMAGTGNFHLAIMGNGGHAATPHKTIDPIPISAQIINALQTIVSRKIDPYHPVVFTIGTIKGGTRRSIIPERVDMTGTVRSFNMELLEKTIPDLMNKIIEGITKGNGANYQLNYGVNLPPVINDERIMRMAEITLKRSFKDDAVLLNEAPMTGDDFSYFAKLIPSIYLKLGTSNENEYTNYPLHNPKFDVDESCIGVGIRAVAQIVLDFLANEDNK